MARKVAIEWAESALADLDDLAAWIAIENETAARNLVTRVLDRVARLQRFPNSGRWVPELDFKLYREVIVRPCRIIYRREGTRILIVRVMRSERLLRVDELT